MDIKNTLYVVVPCYNEEEVLPETAKRLKQKMEALMQAGKIIHAGNSAGGDHIQTGLFRQKLCVLHIRPG